MPPRSTGTSSDVFVTRLDLASAASGQRTYSTYLGGTKYDTGLALAVDASGRAYVAGYTQSVDFPTTSGAFDTSIGGTQDAFVAKLAVAKGKVQVTKTVNWNGVTPDPGQTFSVCIAGPSYPVANCQSAPYNGGTLTWSNLIPGSYTVSETDPGTAWTVQVAGSPVTVPADGGTGSATVTNTRKNGGLQVTKTVQWNGAAPEPTKTFEICISGPSYPAPGKNCKTAAYNGGTLVWTGLAPGSYTVTETDPGTAWSVSIAGSPANVQNGATAEAAVSNNRKLGSLEVTKSVNWNGVTPEGDTFEICIGRAVVSHRQLQDDRFARRRPHLDEPDPRQLHGDRDKPGRVGCGRHGLAGYGAHKRRQSRRPGRQHPQARQPAAHEEHKLERGHARRWDGLRHLHPGSVLPLDAKLQDLHLRGRPRSDLGQPAARRLHGHRDEPRRASGASRL